MYDAHVTSNLVSDLSSASTASTLVYLDAPPGTRLLSHLIFDGGAPVAFVDLRHVIMDRAWLTRCAQSALVEKLTFACW